MRAWLTRQADGTFMLTARQPVFAAVDGTQAVNSYVPYSDALGLRHFCRSGVCAEEHGAARMRVNDYVECEVSLRIVGEVRRGEAT